MATTETEPANRTLEIRKGNVVVGLLDRPVEIDGKPEVRFERIVVRGDLSGTLEYEGRHLRIESVERFVGIEITDGHVEGPIWRGAAAQVLPA